MKLTDLKKYNFHDCRAYDFEFDNQSKTFSFTIETTESLRKQLHSHLVKVSFYNVCNMKYNLNLQTQNDFLLNIWINKSNKNLIEIIFDNQDFPTIYLNAKSLEIQCVE